VWALADAPAPVAEFEALRLGIARADAALRTGEAEFRAAFEQAPVAMSQSDPATGRLLRVNNSYCELVGRPAADLVGRRFAEITHPDDREGEHGTWARMVRGEVPGYEREKRFVRPDGSVRWARVTASVVRGPDGRVLRTMVAARDVTDRKTAEEALSESEERLRAVVDATPECVKLVGADGALLQMNPAGLRALGAAPEEVLGRPVLGLVAPEHRELWAANHARVCDGEALVWEFDIVALDGRRRSMETHAVPLRLPGGGPLAHLGVARDVTERKAAAERQALLVRELDHRAKNALAVVQAALRLTPKDDPHAYARAVEGRVAALARAHTLLARARWAGADLRAVAEGELAPFLGAGAGAARGAGPRAGLEGPALALTPGAAQALSMALHELATNATKHGALSAPGGRVSLSWAVDRASGELRLRWAERGGPPVAAPPERRGFGSRVLEATVRGQLGGRVSRAWEPAGLVCDIEVPLAQAAPLAA
jgi:PAS domain S-box-containing protein